MKKLITVMGCSIFICCAFAQNNFSTSILVRHDTALLNASECEWLVKSLVKNNPALTSQIGKPLPLIMLQLIEKGKLKAIDPETNIPIPPKEIFTWKMPEDTVPVYDEAGNITKYQALKREHSSELIKQVRIFQDWYVDVATGKFFSVIKWIELRENVFTSQGIFIGTMALCRIYY